MKKISFDLDEKIFEDLKIILKNENLKQGKFVEEAVAQKIDAIIGEKKYYDLYYITATNRISRKLFFARDYSLIKEETVLSDAELSLGFVATGIAKNRKTNIDTRVFSKFYFSDLV